MKRVLLIFALSLWCSIVPRLDAEVTVKAVESGGNITFFLQGADDEVRIEYPIKPRVALVKDGKNLAMFRYVDVSYEDGGVKLFVRPQSVKVFRLNKDEPVVIFSGSRKNFWKDEDISLATGMKDIDQAFSLPSVDLINRKGFMPSLTLECKVNGVSREFSIVLKKEAKRKRSVKP